MIRVKFLAFFITLLMVGVMTTVTTSAESGEEARSNPVAAVSIGANGIGFSPTVNYAQLVLTVSRPDGTVYSKTFASGYSPFINLSELAGDQIVDGSYTYELRVIPHVSSLSRSQADRESGKHFKHALVQSGAFRVQGGSMVIPTREPDTGVSLPTGNEGGISTVKDIMHLDDVIITFSLCVGNDCVNGESFGFDTIRLKENNLRIRFYDTSNSASFPTRDWQITVNDSSNGGANKFSIDDIDGGRTPFTIEAGAPSHSLYVDDGGRVGFGTATPVTDLHVKTGNTPTLRLEQDGSSGFTPQTWDVSGNEANFFIRDATNGSTLPIRVQPGAPSSGISLMSDGKVGLGTWSPGFAMHLLTSGSAATFVCEQSGAAQGMISAGANYVFMGGKTNHDFRLLSNNAVVMTLETDGDIAIGNDPNTASASYKLQVWNDAQSAYGYSDGGAWATGSSREFKENIVALTTEEALTALEELSPVKFNYKKVENDEHVGFIAEEVPELVAVKNRDAVSAMDVVAVLTKVVKEQQKAFQEQQETIAQLKAKIAALEKNK